MVAAGQVYHVGCAGALVCASVSDGVVVVVAVAKSRVSKCESETNRDQETHTHTHTHKRLLDVQLLKEM